MRKVLYPERQCLLQILDRNSHLRDESTQVLSVTAFCVDSPRSVEASLKEFAISMTGRLPKDVVIRVMHFNFDWVSGYWAELDKLLCSYVQQGFAICAKTEYGSFSAFEKDGKLRLKKTAAYA